MRPMRKHRNQGVYPAKGVPLQVSGHVTLLLCTQVVFSGGVLSKVETS
jgi:hypothetical protein